MYVDYTEIKEHTLALLAISKGQGDPAPYLEKLKETVAEKTGIPSPLVSFLANRSKKFVSTVAEKAKTQPAQAN